MNVAHAYAGTNAQQQYSSSRLLNHSMTQHQANDSGSISIRSRLGEPVVKSSNSAHEDILDINFSPNYEFEDLEYEDVLPSGTHSNKSQSSNSIVYFSQNFHKNSKEIKENNEDSELIHRHIQKCMNYFKVFNFKEVFEINNFNQLNCDLTKKFECKIKANCNRMDSNKTTVKSKPESAWIVDSGATLHMCSSSELLTNFTPHFGHNVIISDGSTIPIHGYGTLTIFLKDDHYNAIHKLILCKVAVLPKLSVNLKSVRALASLGVSVKFTEHSCYILHPKFKVLLASISNSSYIFRITSKEKDESVLFNTAMTCIHEWHRNLGHKNIAHMNKIKHTLNLKIEKCNCPTECISCLKGKFTALPFPQESEKPINPRDIITTDVCGALHRLEDPIIL